MLILCHYLPDSACGLLLPPTFSPFTFSLCSVRFSLDIIVKNCFYYFCRNKISYIVIIFQRLNIGKGQYKPQFNLYNYKINQCYSTEKVIVMIKVFCSVQIFVNIYVRKSGITKTERRLKPCFRDPCIERQFREFFVSQGINIFKNTSRASIMAKLITLLQIRWILTEYNISSLALNIIDIMVTHNTRLSKSLQQQQ